MKKIYKQFFLGFVGIALLFSAVNRANADTYVTNFDNFTIGSINGQDGWIKTGAYDAAVVSNTFGFSPFGSQSLRISDAVTNGSFGDQTFAKPLVNAAGETDSTARTFSIGTLQNHFETQFDIASAVSNVQQPGMHLSVSPDRGDGSRMSYLRFEDGADGINVFFDDVQQPNACTPSGCANFVETQVGTNLTHAIPHTIKLTIDFIDGPSNDIVKVYIDGTLVHTGTSWEDYYRFDPEASAEQSPRIVKTVMFRESGTANPTDSGKGFLIDNFSSLSGVTPIPVITIPTGGGGLLVSPQPENPVILPAPSVAPLPGLPNTGVQPNFANTTGGVVVPVPNPQNVVAVIPPKLPNTGIIQITKTQAIAAFHRTLRYGAQGTDVAELQNILMQKGFLAALPGAADGSLGPISRAAIKKYQISAGLVSDGVFGPLTKTKLISELGD
jgi:hypothetical protein